MLYIAVDIKTTYFNFLILVLHFYLEQHKKLG